MIRSSILERKQPAHLILSNSRLKSFRQDSCHVFFIACPDTDILILAAEKLFTLLWCCMRVRMTEIRQSLLYTAIELLVIWFRFSFFDTCLYDPLLQFVSNGRRKHDLVHDLESDLLLDKPKTNPWQRHRVETDSQTS